MSHHEFEYPKEVLEARLSDLAKNQQASPAGPESSVEPERERPKPQISPALQEEIKRRLKEAELPPVTSEYVKPEGATEPIKKPPYTPRADANSISADLPSQFAFYDFKDLFIGKLKTRHYAKLHEAHVTHSLEYLVECISDILSTSHSDYQNVPLGFHLTIPDFYWVLYYLRLDQVKTSLVHSTMCNNPVHLQAVENKEKSPETLKITAQVTRSQIHTKILDAVPSSDEFKFDGFELKPARMLDVIESLNHPEYLESADVRYLCRVASMVRITDSPDATIEERIAIIDDLDFEQLAQIGKYEQIITSYGPDEFINVTCKECGHQRRTKVQLDARSFLPLQ